MKRKPLVTWFPFRFALLIAPLVAAWPQRAQAVTLYWDINGATANVAGAVTGAWNGTNVFWTSGVNAATGTGVAQAGTTAADDLIFSSGTIYTTGTITASGARAASSITFEDPIVTTLAGAVTIGGTGAKSGIFALSTATANSTVSGAQTLAAASTIQNAGTGVLSITGGITGAFNLTLQNNGATANGVTIATGSLNNTGTVTNSGTGGGSTLISAVIGANVTSLIQNSATNNLILSGTNLYTGTTSITAGSVTAQNNAAFGAATGGGVTVSPGGAINLGGTLAANALNLGAKVITVSGTGVSGTGALLSTATNSQQNALQQVVLAGNTTIGGTQRFDIRSANPLGASLSSTGGPFSITKIGSNYVPLVNVNVANLNQFLIQDNGMGAEVTTVLSSAAVAGGVLIQPTGTNTAYWNNWGNFVTHTADYTLDTTSAGSTARLEIQNGNTTYNGALTITGGGTNNIDVDSGWNAIVNGALGGSGTLNKIDAGALLLNNAINPHNGILNVNAGILGGIGTLASTTVNFAAGTTISPGNATIGSGTLSITNTLVSTGANNAAFNIGTASDKVNVGTLTQDGNTTISVVASPGFAAGTYTLFDYGTLNGVNGFGGYALGNHIDGVLKNNLGATSIELQLNSANPLTWTGLSNNILTAGSLTNPLLPNFNWPAYPGGQVEFVAADNVLFDDTAAGPTSLLVTGTVAPGSLRFNNSTLPYTIDGAISGSTGLIKDGTNTLTFLTNQTFNGPVALNAGIIQLGNDSRSALIAGSSSVGTTGAMPAISLAAGTTLGISAGGNAEINVANNLSGSGSIVLNATQQDNYYNTITDRGNVAFRGDNTGFTGTITINDGNRLRANTVNALGNTASITIADGGALLFDPTSPATYGGPISVAGQGWQETGGSVGALRLNNGVTLSGPITLTGDTRFTALGGVTSIGTISGVISGAATTDLEYGFRNISGTSSGTLNIPNAANSYGGETTLTRMTINAATIANTGINSSLGAGNAVNFEVGVLSLSGLTAGADAMTSNRTLRLNQLGIGGATIGLTDPLDSLTLTGAVVNGNSSFGLGTLNFQQNVTNGTGGTVVLNTATPIVSGGTDIHRQNLTLAGSTSFTVGYPVTGTVAAPNGFPGALNVGNNTNAVGNAGAVTLTIQDTAVLTTYGNFDIGNQDSGALVNTTINQTGGTVNALRGGGSFASGTTDTSNRAMRIGHWPNNNAIYNLAGGILNAPNGYINLAQDGTGTFNQSAGTTANLRGLRVGNGAAVAAIGIYNLDGGTLNIGDLGITRGGSLTTHQINLNGGTLRASTYDFTIGASLPINVKSGGAVVDTNGFNIASSSPFLDGTGGGGLIKNGPGLLELPAGNTYTGATTVNAGSLGGASSTFTASNVTVNAGASVSGGASFTTATGTALTIAANGTVSPGANSGSGLGTITAATANLAAGANLNLTPGIAGTRDFFNVTGAAGLTTPTVGKAILNVLPVGGTLAAGTYDLVGYNTSIAGGGYAGFTVNLPHMVGSSVADNGLGLIQITHGGQETLTWTGGTNGIWNTAASNFNASVSGPVPFLQGDVAAFDSTTAPANPAITIPAGGVTPASVTINDAGVGIFSFTGGGIGGGTSLNKNGAGTTVLANNNTYGGTTTITAGTLQIGNGGTTGTLGLANTVNNGTLSFNRADSSTYAGVISGSGIVRNDGPGTTNLLGLNTYTGGTVISKGTMVGLTGTSFGTAAANTITLNDASTGSADTGLYFNPILNDGAITVPNNIVVANAGSGTVRIGSAERSNVGTGTVFSGTLTLGRDVTLFAETDRTTFSGVISGTADIITIAPSAGLSVGQPGRVTWEATNTFVPSGASPATVRILEGAILQLGHTVAGDQVPDAAAVEVQAGGVLQLGIAADSETIGTLTGAGTVRNITNTALNLTFGTAAPGTFSGVMNGGNLLSYVKQGSGTQTISGVLDNPGANLTINAGTALLAKTSTPTVHALGGAVTINNTGTLQLGGTYIDTRPASDGRAGANTAPRNAPANYVDQILNSVAVTVNAGGVLDLAGKSEAIDTLLGTGTVRNTSATASTLYLGTNGGSGVFSGLIEDGTGAVNLVKGGTGGTITLATANTYTGTTEIRGGGGLTINNVGSLGSTAGGTTLSANRDAAALLTIAIATVSDPLAPNIIAEAFDLISETSGDQRTNMINNTESTRLTGAISVTGDGLMQINAAQAAGDQFQINGPITGTANGILFLRGSGEMQLNGVINAPNLQVAKTDGGLLILNATGNNYGEASFVSGTVRTDVAGALDSSAILRMGQGANANTLELNGNSQTVAGVRLNLGVSDAFARTISNTGAAANFTINIPTADGSDQNFAGNFTGNLSLIKAGPGAQALSTPLSGVNSYTGDTVVQNGQLRLGGPNLIPDGVTAGNLIVGTGLTAATFDLNANSDTVNGLHGNSLGVVTSNGSGVATLTVGGSATPLTSATFDGVLRNNLDGGAGTLALAKTGSGTQILTGTNTYSGPTTISGGTLVINGDHSGASGAINVATGGILGGSGTLGGPLNFADGTFSPGNSPGTLTTSGPVSFGAASVLNYELAGNNTAVGGGINDLLTGVTNLTLGGTLNVAEIGPGSFLLANLGDMWRIMNYSGTLTGTLAVGTTPTLSPGLNFELNTATPNQVNLVVVPETSAVSLVGLATLFTLRRRRRKAA